MQTSQERPKSAPYLSSKIAKGLQSVKYSLLQYPHEEKIEKKIEIFFKIFWSSVSRIVPKNIKGDLKKSLINLYLKCQVVWHLVLVQVSL